MPSWRRPDRRLRRSRKAVLAAIQQLRNHPQSTRGRRIVYGSQKRMAEITGLTLPTVNRAVTALHDEEYIIRHSYAAGASWRIAGYEILRTTYKE